MIPVKWLILGGIAVAGAVSALLSSSRETAEETNEPETVQYVPQEIPRHENVPARVVRIRHEYDPFRMADCARVTFSLPEEKEITLSITGEGAYHVAEGDDGLLTWVGDTLVAFEMANGDNVTAQFYLPAGTENGDE